MENSAFIQFCLPNALHFILLLSLFSSSSNNSYPYVKFHRFSFFHSAQTNSCVWLQSNAHNILSYTNTDKRTHTYTYMGYMDFSRYVSNKHCLYMRRFVFFMLLLSLFLCVFFFFFFKFF